MNSDAEGEGWFFRLELDDTAAFEALLDQDAYDEFLETLVRHGCPGRLDSGRTAELEAADGFVRRHIGPSETESPRCCTWSARRRWTMWRRKTVPAAIRSNAALDLPPPIDEAGVHRRTARAGGAERDGKKSLIGMGYHGTVTPPVILRNVLENPGWYTAYTPYQAEIAQGRLEALLNFQTMICELTGMQIANASLLDEATAAAEAMAMAHALSKTKSDVLAVATDLHPQTRAVLATRAKPLGIDAGRLWRRAISPRSARRKPFALVLQYPGTTGALRDLSPEIAAAHEVGRAGDRRGRSAGAGAADAAGRDGRRHRRRLGAALRRADGVRRPACRVLRHARRVQAAHARAAGRRVGGCRAAQPAMRLALQTREQHIRREKATSNICTAQVLLAVIAGFYAVWHGPEGLRRIARRVNLQARDCWPMRRCAAGMRLRHDAFFDTIVVECGDADDADRARALAAGFNLRRVDDDRRRHRAGRDGDARRTGALAAAAGRRPGRRGRRAFRPSCLRGTFVPGASGVQPASRRTRDAALSEAAGGQGHRAEPQHDPAGVLHDEAERDGGDDRRSPGRASPTSIPFAPADQTDGLL